MVEVRLADLAGGPDVEVSFRPDAGVTAGRLVEAWPGAGSGVLHADGRSATATTPLATLGLADGSTVGVTDGTTPAAPGDRLVVVGGPAPAPALVLDPGGGDLLVGRGPAAALVLDHPDVPEAAVLVAHTDAGWTVSGLTAPDPGVTLDDRPVGAPVPLEPTGRLAIGPFRLALVPGPPPGPRPSATIHQPPRLAPPPLPDVPAAPAAPTPEPAPTPPGALTLALPVVTGAALALLVHPLAGLLGAATPVLAVGAHLDARRRHRRQGRRAERDNEAARRDHDEHRWARDQERIRRRREAFPDPATALDRARTGVGLWTGHPDDSGAVEVAVGHGTDGDPVTVHLGGDRVVGLVGPPDATAAVALAVVLQAAVRHGPAALTVEPPTDGAARPLRWLPHRRGPGPTLRPAGPGGHLDQATTVAGLDRRCTTVLRLGPGGATLTDADGARHEVALQPVLADLDLAEATARALARWRDPDTGADGEAPVRLADLADPPAGDRPSLATTVGLGPDGPLVVDLVAHGPHALVAGTTGAGKSELLRTLVTGLARAHPPDAVTFVLADFKGGSAFDACADLPHVVGLVTDLDDGLADRLLTALRAELRDREVTLRAAGVGDLAELTDGPPRLVVVVDEFATLAHDHPDALDALVDLARRGRSLGLHLVLATQRPAGVVSDEIRANTALRIALRLLDTTDATDVVGDPAAADLPADRPGRALLRLDGALVPARVATTAQPAAPPDLLVRREGDPRPVARDDGPARLVTAVAQRWADRPRPRPLWLPPLPTDLAWAPGPDAAHEADGVTVGLVDRPADRRQLPLTWRPGQGGLVVLAGPGRGASTALVTATLALTDGPAPADLVVHVVGAADGPTGVLARLPHLGAMVDPADRAAVRRLLARLAHGGAGPPFALVVDGTDRLVTGVDDLDGIRALEHLDAIVGGDRGTTLLAADRPTALPPRALPTADLVVSLGGTDPTADTLLGLRPTAPGPPGRGRTRGGDTAQVARVVDPATLLDDRQRRDGAPDRSRAEVARPLPLVVARADLGRPPRPGAVVIGRRDRDLGVAAVDAAAGVPVVVAGPPGSGRTHTLDLIAGQLTDRPRSVHHGGEPGPLLAAVARWLAAPGPHVFVLDDADRVLDPDGHLAALVAGLRPDTTLVVGLAAPRWRTGYGTWTAALRPAGLGLALAPDPARDGDCWSVPLAGWQPAPGAPVPGRGLLVTPAGTEVVQVAR